MNSYKHFTLKGNTYECRYYTNKEVATEILPRLYGRTIEKLTYGELDIITRMLNYGWTLLPRYDEEFIDDGIGNMYLKPDYSWFTLWCDDETELHQYTCKITYDANVVKLYDDRRAVATFMTIDDMFNCMKQLEKTEPLKVNKYSNTNTDKNLESFDIYGIDNEIFQKNNEVFETIDNTDIDFELDMDRIYEIKTKSEE
jgi:hypothetical protein